MASLIYIKYREQPISVLESYDELVEQLTAIDPVRWTARWINVTFDDRFATISVDSIDFIIDETEPDPEPQAIGEFQPGYVMPSPGPMRASHTLPEDIEQ
jgi:hypothetical protein